MEIYVARCAGLDVHKRTVAACVRTPGDGGSRRQVVRTFRTFAQDLAELRGWLLDEGVTRAVMESTGVLWRPVWRALEGAVEELWLVNAAHVKALPGRKTDVADAAWLCQLAECGLVAPSFVPPAPIRRLRELTRYRRRLVQARTQQVQRLDKVLEDAGIKVSSVASSTLLVSTRRMVEALIAGERDAKALADLALKRLRSKHDLLCLALDTRHFEDHHATMCRVVLDHLDHLEARVAELDAAIRAASPGFTEELRRLCTIPGVDWIVATTIIAEVGADMGQFPTAAHLASWARLSPGNRESAGRRGSGTNVKGNRWLRAALVQSGWAASHTKGTFLSSRFWHIARTRGKNVAAVAVAHSILVAVWHILHDGVDYHDLGGDWHSKRAYDPNTRRRWLVAELEELTGHKVTLAATG